MENKKAMFNLKNDEVSKINNYSEVKVKISYSEKKDKSFRISRKKCEYEVMKLKKISIPEHRKRRKKRRGSMEKNNKISKEDDELYAKKRKKENAKPKKMMFLVVLLASISTCHGVNRPHSVKGKDD